MRWLGEIKNKMKITVSKIKKELIKKHGWSNLDSQSQKSLVFFLIKDVIEIINTELENKKGISIK
jgi:hypothetical protein